MRVYAKRLFCGFCLLLLLSLVFLLLPKAKDQPEPIRASRHWAEKTNASSSSPNVAKPLLWSARPSPPSIAQYSSPASLPLPTIKPGDGGYLLALSFNEQLESGMFDLHQLADLGTSWKLKAVEPYIHNTQFRFPSLPYDGRLLKLSDLYDLQDFNANLKRSLNVSHDVVVPLNLTKQAAKRGFQVVILQLVPYALSRESCERSNVTKYTQKLASHLQCEVHTCMLQVSVVCVNTREQNNFRNLFDTHPVLEQVSRQALSTGTKILVAIPVWNGIRPYQDRFFYWDPAFERHRYLYVHATAHSREVKSAAQDFLHTLNLKRPTLGIHIRLERLLREKPSNITVVKDCLLVRLRNLVRSLQGKHSIQSAIMFRDYGKYGSQTCSNVHCNQFAMELGLDLGMEGIGVHVLEYRPQSRKIRKEHGFSANVEQEILALTDYLVTVGYGSFQKGVVSRFKRHKAGIKNPQKQKRIFEICS